MKVYHTEQRQRILESFESNHDATVTEGDIAAALSSVVSKSAVYRNLADLEKEGKVVRVSLNGGRSAGYRYAASKHCAGKIHISCVRCGKTEHVSGKAAASFEKALRETDGFLLSKGECLLYGVCKSCSQGGQK